MALISGAYYHSYKYLYNKDLISMWFLLHYIIEVLKKAVKVNIFITRRDLQSFFSNLEETINF